jgi:TRAP-type C4-dicarboxylate transport system substrate-binding protein
MLRKGLVDITNVVPSFYAGRFPLEDAFHLPFLCPGAMGDPRSDRIVKMMYEKYLIPIYFSDVKVLWLGRFPRLTLHMAKKPVRTMEDLKGLVIGFPGGRILPKMLGLMGASGEHTLIPDMYTNLDRGVIDGMFIPRDTVPAFKLHEVQKYNTMVDPGSGSHFVAMNLKAWNKISPADQKIIEDLSPWVVERHIKALAGVHGYSKKLFMDAGVEMIDLSPEEQARWKKVSKPVRDEWIKEVEGKGLPGKAVFDDINKIMSESPKH